MSKKKFSVIMPLYNHEKYVDEAINSVLNQSYENFELIICNDGSTDNSLEKLQAYNDDRIKIIDKPNGGTVSALNTCILESNGEFICWLSSDDYYNKDKLNYHLFAHNNSGALLSIAPSASFKGDKISPILYDIPSGPTRLLPFFGKNPINGLAICAHRNLYLQYGLFNPRYKYSHDYERWLCFLRHVDPIYVNGDPQSFTRLGTSFVEDSSPFVLGILDNIKVLIGLVGNGLENITPIEYPINNDSLTYLLQHFLSLSKSSNNYFYRHGISDVYIKAICRFILKFKAIDNLEFLNNSSFYDSSENIKGIIDQCKIRVETGDILHDPFTFAIFLKSLSNSTKIQDKEKKGISLYVRDSFS
jgi:glycosyltransferase involved in cell wall biosynthesis